MSAYEGSWTLLFCHPASFTPVCTTEFIELARRKPEFDELGVEYVKRPDDGNMKGLAFIKDPDGYWIEILSPTGLAKITAGQA